MNAIVTQNSGGAVAKMTAAPPRISQALDILITDVCQSRPLNIPTAPVRKEAMSALERLEALCEPGTHAEVMAWLLPFASIGVPMSPDQFRSRAAITATGVCHLPKAVFTAATQTEGIQEFIYFPDAPKVLSLLMPKCRDWIRDRDALRKIVALPVPPPPKEITQEERDAILARFNAQMAEVRAAAHDVQRAQEAATPVRASHVPPEELAKMRANDPLVQRAFAIQRELREAEEAKAALAAAIVTQRAAPDRSAVRLPWDDAA